jgi:cytochrome oxidase Cu insertion factor (SCO1/SenC/PrrC family)
MRGMRSAVAPAAVGVGIVLLIGAMLAFRPTGTPAPSAERDYIGSTPPAHLLAAAFDLPSYRGPHVRLAALRGKVVLMTFLDTDCTDQCPVIARFIARGLRALTPAARQKTVALALSTDPRIDTPASIRSFLTKERANGALDFPVDSVPRMRPVWKAYYVLPAVDSGNANIHSDEVMIVTPRGRWASTLNSGVDLTPQNIRHEIGVALEDKS